MDNDPGWPRPVLPAEDHLGLSIKRVNSSYLPVMWVSGDLAEAGHWVAFDSDRMAECIKEINRDPVCIVCGENLGDDWVEAHLDDDGGVAAISSKGHVRCILLAVMNCPHFKDREIVAHTPESGDLTREDLYEMKKAKV